jgi:hypothetical protein
MVCPPLTLSASHLVELVRGGDSVAGKVVVRPCDVEARDVDARSRQP